MKPRRVGLHDVRDANALAERILQTRLGEARDLTTGFEGRDKQGLHDFRIACKRLRYALERFEALEPSLQEAADRLASLQDALGEAHDRDVLLSILPPTMPATECRLQRDREASVDRACVLWNDLKQSLQALDSHRI